jgi:hypothetical protein
MDNLRIKRMFASNNIFFNHPRISNDNKKVVFLQFSDTNERNSKICVANIDGTGMEVVMENSDAGRPFLCDNDTDIIFTEASVFGSYSPVSKASRHGFDIFKVNRFTKKVKKISKLDAYILDVTSQITKDSYLAYSYDDGDGIFLFSENQRDTLIRIKENERSKNKEWMDLFYDPLYHQKSGCYVFSNGWGILKMDKNGNVTTIIELKEGRICNFDLFHNSERIAYIIDSDPNCIYFVNFDGTGKQKIFIRSPHY